MEESAAAGHADDVQAYQNFKEFCTRTPKVCSISAQGKQRAALGKFGRMRPRPETGTVGI